jgi:2-polyprenyl-6-methoxyphenol hydroxylase-like FAD-dependent oxidoreductase
VDPEMSDLQNDWNRVVPISRFAHLFDEWEWEWLNVPELIRTADEVLEYPMVDREPLDSWVRGRTVLLGDTAHPTYPVGSNGTSQALLDARTLAYALAAFSLEHALEFYQEQRLPATAALQNANRKMGPELVLQMVHERAPQGYSDIHDVIPEVELEQIAENYKKVAGFDRDTLNSQPSWDDLLVKGQNDND